MSTQAFAGINNQVVEVLAELQRRGLTVRADGNDLLLKPKGAMDDTLRSRILEVKPEILEILRDRPVTCCLDCYQLERGIWVHRPWAGCKTIKAEAAEEAGGVVLVTCWHCRGEKVCDCSACWKGVNRCACTFCKGTGRMRVWAQ